MNISVYQYFGGVLLTCALLYRWMKALRKIVNSCIFLHSGIPQGKLIKRQQLPKDDLGNTWHWKDLNLAINVTFYGKVIRICNCDEWTKV